MPLAKTKDVEEGVEGMPLAKTQNVEEGVEGVIRQFLCPAPRCRGRSVSDQELAWKLIEPPLVLTLLCHC